MKQGDVVFFKKAKTGIKKGASVELGFKGYAFGILLGYCPPAVPEPDRAMCNRLLGQIGLISFDDIGEFLGEELQTSVIEKFKEKYYSQEKSSPQKKGSSVVGLDGKPIST